MLKLMFLITMIMAAPAQSGTLKIELKGVKAKQNGQVLCAVFRNENGFPMHPESALEIQQAIPSNEKFYECSFYNLRAGEYAVSVLHDLNGDGKMSTNKLGMPQEGWATSNNVEPPMRPPTFKESSVKLSDKDLALSLKMHY